MATNQQQFILWYNNDFKQSDEYQPLIEMAELSPWHREKSIAIHTDMVVSHYLNMSRVETTPEICGAFAAAFHDVGKPASRQEKFKPERGNYFSFNGHEPISARMWENYAIANWDKLSLINNDPVNIYRIGWLIENHLPWGIKVQEKRAALAQTVLRLGIDRALLDLLMSDTLGRLSDDAEQKLAKVKSWFIEFNELLFTEQDKIFNQASASEDENQRILYMPIAPSGSGKTTYRQKLLAMNPNIETFSLDDLRHEFYDANDYSNAYKMSTEDSQFSAKANARFVLAVKSGNDVFVDNTNLSKKRRRFYITEARRHGYKVFAVLFPNTLQTLIDRQVSRSDKSVPDYAVRQHYQSLQLPSFGEVDNVEIVMPD